jgi:hypothetical protein
VRRFSVSSPFSSGYISDAPSYAVPLDNASFAQDVFAPSGVIRQRRGWKASASSATLSSPTAVAKVKFALRDNAVRYVANTATGIHFFASDGTTETTTSYGGGYVPRCVYEGELIFCHPGGEKPLLRYAGAIGGNGTVANSAVNYSYNKGGRGWNSASSLHRTASDAGRYYAIDAPDTTYPTSTYAHQPPVCDRVVEGKLSGGGTDWEFTYLVSAPATHLGFTGTFVNSNVGVTWPAVIRQEFFSSVSGTTITPSNFSPDTTPGTGNIHWDALGTQFHHNDAVVVAEDGADHKIARITATSSTTLTTVYATGVTTGSQHRTYILARCPWSDATVHKESLWGCGTKQYPSTVWVWPPAHPLSIPPGSIDPYNITYNAGYESGAVTGFRGTAGYTLFSFDVPSKYDATPIVALLSTDGPLLVLKSDSVYGVYGVYDPTQQASGGGLEVRRITDWGGCVDLRSAISGENGQYWCGADGIYAWRNSAIVDLTAGKIQKEWKALMRGYVSGTSIVTCGIANDRYLVVAASGLDSSLTSDAQIGPDSSAPTERTLIYDIPTESWMGRVTNFTPVHMWTARFEDGGSECLGVDTSYNKFMNFTPAVSETGQSSAADGDSTLPRMQLWSSSSIAQAEGVEGETKFCDLIVHSNLYDSATPSSSVSISVVSGGSIGTPLDTTKVLSPILGDAVDRIDRHKRIVNKSGRLHQIRFDMDATDTDNKNSEIGELVFSFRDSRRGT